MNKSRHQLAIKGWRWDRLRRRVLDSANWRCAHCGSYGNEVDHINPMEHGGAAYDLGNLQVLCRGCHIAKTKADRGIVPDPVRDAWVAEVERLVRGFTRPVC